MIEIEGKRAKERNNERQKEEHQALHPGVISWGCLQRAGGGNLYLSHLVYLRCNLWLKVGQPMPKSRDDCTSSGLQLTRRRTRGLAGRAGHRAATEKRRSLGKNETGIAVLLLGYYSQPA